MTDEQQKPGIVCVPMTVGELAEKLNRPVNAVIVMLLKQGIVATRNQVVTAEVVARAAEFFDVPVIEAVSEKRESVRERALLVGRLPYERMPVVVVVGHVDHGKTTLLDYIRKTRVAAREKGGITQHIGAYEAHTDHGNLVFIDTPGHEAFSVMRSRGLSIADLAVLVVGVDNGVQPQTIEAYELAKAAQVPIVVALNKIDKVTPKQIEEVRHALNKIGLVPEEWGGETVFIPVSALKGDGVDQLLDMLMLQAKMIGGLTSYLDVPSLGFVLESRFEKGRGPVATVINRTGVLRIGDSFVCGNAFGKVSSIKDFAGTSIKEAKPSEPIVIAGFSELPRAGDMFKVVPAAALKAEHIEERALSPSALTVASAPRPGAIRVIVKADTASGKEVLVSSLEKLSAKAHSGVSIVASGVGTITESDIALAADTQAMVLGLHVKMDAQATRLAQEFQVTVKLFDIIYKLLEMLEELLQRGKPVKKVIKKTGEAVVLKVFDIKKLGIVAGAQMVDGTCNRNSTVKIFRSARLVGKGSISSLQRDRNSVKEVRKGFECAFMVDGFTDWQVDDRVECYSEVKED
ncbi:MAG: Translation initiation factor IF-2 [candidate division TM6 bacterium GW2011_GWF2_43_87]|nr:MAG: Translation initiation factor IF-2 [candidate division TM6 bacterium GW2011_GWF2_43_87]